jgi:hypothetical protein
VASKLLLLGALESGCASVSSPGASLPGESAALAPSARGYEIHEASEAADTDGLQVSLDHGFISQEAAQEAVMRRWPDLRHCYADAGAATAFAGGRVSLRFSVAPSGATSAVDVVETGLGNFAVERCLIGVGRTVSFPRPQGGAPATVEYSLEFQPSGQVAVVDLPDGELDTSLPALLGQLATRCDGLGGDEVSATVYVDASGTVRSNGLASATPLDPAAAACLSAALSQATLPRASVRGSTLGRARLSLRATDLVARETVTASPAHAQRRR